MMRLMPMLTVFVAIAVTGRAHSDAAASQPDRPNIILIMADDLGVEGLGCYGGTSYRTPCLDQMASEGQRFLHAYAQPLCTNSRVQLMTGLYNHRNWLAFGLLDPSAKTIGHWFSEAGYRTCIAGKWQLQSYDPVDYPGAEHRRGKGMKVQDAGFEEVSLWHTAHTEDKGPRYADPVVVQNGRFRNDLKGKYGPDVSVEFIKKFLEGKDDRPFFVYYPMALPHWPFVPTPRSQDWGIEEKMHPPLGTTGGDGKYFPDMVEYMDYCVGQIVESVDALGLKEETLIIYYSDNGTDRKVVSQTVHGPIQGGKGLTTDAGTHVPLIVRWPGTVRPGVNELLVDSTDFLPTLLDAAGSPMGSDVLCDGLSFYSQLVGQSGPQRKWTYCFFDPRPGWDKDKFRRLVYARDKRFKLYEDGRFFDVAGDRLEMSPLDESRLNVEAVAARRQLQDVLLQMNP